MIDNLSEGQYLKILGCRVKNDNGIYVIAKKYGEGSYCLHKCKTNGEKAKVEYGIFFLDEKTFVRDPDISIEFVSKEQLPESQKEINNYLKERFTNEIIYNFIPGTTQSKFLQVVKTIHLTNRLNSIYNCIYEIVGVRDGRYDLHLIGKKGNKVSYNINNTYQGRPIILRMRKSDIERLVAEAKVVYVDRVESKRGEQK